VKVDQKLLLVGREIRRRRKERKLSQEELAELAGLHRNYIGGIERGERNVGVRAYIDIALALGASPGDLFCGFTQTP